jgi:hypothetical protein
MLTHYNQGNVSDLQVDLGEEEFDPAEDTYCGINVTKTHPDSPTHDQTSLQNDMESFPQPSSDPKGHSKLKKSSFGPAPNTASHPKGPVPVPTRRRFSVRPHKKFAEKTTGLQKSTGPFPLSPLTLKEPRPTKKGDFGQSSSRLPHHDDPLPLAINDHSAPPTTNLAETPADDQNVPRSPPQSPSQFPCRTMRPIVAYNFSCMHSGLPGTVGMFGLRGVLMYTPCKALQPWSNPSITLVN